MSKTVDLNAEIGVGSMVTFRSAPNFRWVVVRLGGWWRPGRVLVSTRTNVGSSLQEWVYAGELRLWEDDE